MLVVVFGHPHHPSVEYMDPLRPPLALRGRLGSFPSRFTPLDHFGMTPRFEPDGGVAITYSRPGTATYPDGKPRRWQGRGKAVIDIRPSLAGHVIKAIRAIHAPANGQEHADATGGTNTGREGL